MLGVDKVLVVDAGNTSVKYTAYNTNRLLWCLRDDEYQITSFVPDAIFFASVRSAEQSALLRSKLQGVFPDSKWVLLESVRSSCGVENAYKEPSRLGIDRWLSIIGAYHLVKNSLVVVDAGTAIKVDVVSFDGVHLGGYIVPGLALMEKMLLSNTARIRYEPNEIEEGDGLPNSTARAVTQGCREMALSFLERLYRQYDKSTWVVTGGDAKLLMQELNIPVDYQPNLVALGAKLMGDEALKANL